MARKVGVCVTQYVFLAAELVYQQQLLLRKRETNLFLHAGAGEDPLLLPEAGGDNPGHHSRAAGIFNLEITHILETEQQRTVEMRNVVVCVAQRNVQDS